MSIAQSKKRHERRNRARLTDRLFIFAGRQLEVPGNSEPGIRTSGTLCSEFPFKGEHTADRFEFNLDGPEFFEHVEP
jgi:hypothetical protein